MEMFDQLFNFQCWQAMIKFGSEAVVNNNKKELKKIIKIGWTFDISSAFLGAVSGVAFSSLAGKIFQWDSQQVLFSQIFSLLILLNITGSPIGILRLFRKFKYIAFHRIANGIFKLIVVTIVYFVFKISGIQFFYILLLVQLVDQLSLIIISIVVLTKMGLMDFYKEKKLNWKGFVKFAFWTNIESTINIPVKNLNNKSVK